VLQDGCGDGRMVVIPYPEEFDWADRLALRSTNGACFPEWVAMSNQERLLKLFFQVWHIAYRDRVPLETIHAALMVIPEYRATLSGETCWALSKKEARP
jgi:hypothetical protein